MHDRERKHAFSTRVVCNNNYRVYSSADIDHSSRGRLLPATGTSELFWPCLNKTEGSWDVAVTAG